ncbi:MAG TPA: carboxypeptidase-like regulatory domain-containing protein [Pyrinomonadaceae bacterium]|nr:carboxypeptidase-like regulatory domain-containing protein [Pyrinomonadaceae bacterium]
MNIKFSLSTLRTLIMAAIVCAVALSGTVFAQTTEDQSNDAAADKPNSSSITGRVITQNSQPVTNATVYVSRMNSSSPPRPVPTDSDGHFKFAGLEPGIFSVTASAPSYILPPHDPNPVAQNYYRIGDSVTITMVKGGVINGRVTDAEDKPVVAVRVRALMVRDAYGQAASGVAVERLTDDRGVYRLYGLAPGAYVVSAGGPSAFSAVGGTAFGGFGGGGGVGPGGRGGGGGGGFGFGNPATALYDRDAPTFAPSSTRDTAIEVSVGAGDEVNDVNIKYRSERGHAVSGMVKSAGALMSGYARAVVTLSRANHEGEVVSFVTARGAAFVFYGVANGEYELSAETSIGPDNAEVSQPRHVIVNGNNLTGITLTTNPLASISGRVTLEPSTLEQCKDKRQPRFEEILLSAERSVKKGSEVSLVLPQFSSAKGAPARNGEFLLSKLAPGQYRFDTRFSAKYWYLRAITLSSPTATKPAGKLQQTTVNQTIDVARSGVVVKFGSRVAGLNFALAEGAATLHGRASVSENEKPPQGLFVYLVPAEKDQGENVLRYFVTTISNDGSFTLGNLPPGLYWVLARSNVESESQVASQLRLPEGAEDRMKLRRDGEAAKSSLELKPCQNVSDYQLQSSVASPRAN